MSKRQQHSRSARNSDNTSRYQVVYPGASKKITINQQSSAFPSPNLSLDLNKDFHIDKTDTSETTSNINKLNYINTTISALKNQENYQSHHTNHPIDSNINNYHTNNLDYHQLDSANTKNQSRPDNPSADIENLKQPCNTNKRCRNKSFDLDWVDNYKVQCDLVYSPKRSSLASTTNQQYNQYRNQIKYTTNLIDKLPSPLFHRRSDHNIRDNFDRVSSTSSRNNSLFKGRITLNHSHNKMASNPTIDASDNILFDISNDEATSFYDDGENLEGQLADGQLTDNGGKRGQVPYDYNQLDEPIINTLLRDLGGIYEKMKIIALPNRSSDVYKIILRGWDLWGPLLLCTLLAFSLHNDTTSSTRNNMGPHFADVFVLIWFGSGLLSLNYRLLCLSSINDQSIQIMPGNTNSSTTDTSGDKTTINSGNLHINNNNNKINDDIITSPNRSIPMGANADFGLTTNPEYGMPSTSLQDPMQLSISPPSVLQLMCVFGYCLVAPSFGLFLMKLLPISNLMIWRVIVGLIFGFIWPTWSSIKILKQYQHPDKRALAIYPIGLFYFILSCMIILNQ